MESKELTKLVISDRKSHDGNFCPSFCMRVITHDANIMPQLVIGLALVFSYPKNKNNIWRFRSSNINVGLVHDTSLVLRSGLQGFLGPVHVCRQTRRLPRTALQPDKHSPTTARKSETEANDFIHLHPNSFGSELTT